jgi:hypothetical protein
LDMTQELKASTLAMQSAIRWAGCCVVCHHGVPMYSGLETPVYADKCELISSMMPTRGHHLVGGGLL